MSSPGARGKGVDEEGIEGDVAAGAVEVAVQVALVGLGDVSLESAILVVKIK